MLLNALNIKKEYGIQTVLDIEKLEIRDGDRIGLIGRNGAGKSTLLGVLSGRIACDEGVVKRYCPIAEILQTGETEDEPEARLLSQLKLRDSAVKSGGEKTRRAIGAAFSSQAPLLFADEPTTNLDMEGVALLEKMMRGYRGAILMISHDRTLLDQVCNQIWELDRAAVRVFDGNYSDWASQKERERGFQEFEYQQYHPGPVIADDKGPFPCLYFQAHIVQYNAIPVAHGEMPDSGRVFGPYPPGVRQSHGHLGRFVRAVLFIQVLQPAHDRGFIALHMTLLDSGDAFVEHPLAASHAFGRLCSPP